MRRATLGAKYLACVVAASQGESRHAYTFDAGCSAITSTNAASVVRTIGRSAITNSGGLSSICLRIGTMERERIASRASTVTGPALD